MKKITLGKSGFDSFDKALVAAKDGGADEITFEIDGEFSVGEPINIGLDTFGDGVKRIVFEGIGDASITSGVTVTDFEKYKDNVWRAHVPQVTYTRNLYIDSVFAKRPTTDQAKSSEWNILEGEYKFADENDPAKGIVSSNREALGWKNPRDIEMIFNVGWTHHIIPIETVSESDDGNVLIMPLMVPFVSACKEVGVKIGACPNYFENVFEEMKNPLEWYFDRTEQMLYVCFAQGDGPENHTIEIPMCEELIKISGNPSNRIKNIEFKNIHFKNTSFVRPNIYGFANIQAEFSREDSVSEMPVLEKPYELDSLKFSAAIRIIAGDNINFEGCEFSCIDNTALVMEFGTQNCTIEGCKFYQLGAGAIRLGDVISERSHHPKDKNETVKNITVKNCEICNTGIDFGCTVAVMLGYVAECRVIHNHIHDVPYSGVNVGWGWGEQDISVGPFRPTPWTEPSVCEKNTVSYNYIHNHLQVYFDGGAIYTLGAMEGSEIVGNHIHNAGPFEGKGCEIKAIGGNMLENVDRSQWDPESWKQYKVCFPGGIYLDEGSRGITVDKNILYDIPVPIFYHNKINDGYKMVTIKENFFGVYPDDAEFRKEIADNAGIEAE